LKSNRGPARYPARSFLQSGCDFEQQERTMAEPSDLRAIEMTLAYEQASGILESSCNYIKENSGDDPDSFWLDLGSLDEDLDDEIAYLESRRLLERHPEHAGWVRICDEGEPLEAM
jgi:hypothetical protein